MFPYLLGNIKSAGESISMIYNYVPKLLTELSQDTYTGLLALNTCTLINEHRSYFMVAGAGTMIVLTS